MRFGGLLSHSYFPVESEPSPLRLFLLQPAFLRFRLTYRDLQTLLIVIGVQASETTQMTVLRNLSD